MDIIAQQTSTGFQTSKFRMDKFSGIEEIENELNNSLNDARIEMKEMCRHILRAGGKRVRPLLVLNSGLMFTESSEQLLQAATAAELIHMASLVHDDIIDDSDLRRCKPSINKVWGTHFAVLCGDYLFSKAFGILSNNRLIKSMDLMVEAIQNMCQGEILQAGQRFNHKTDVDMYYDIIGMKTAMFLKYCCMSGAAVSNANSFQTQIIGEYGLNLGYAFQIIDDILDYCGCVVSTGKPKYEDIRQGNITLPLIFLMKDKKHGEWVRKIIEKRDQQEFRFSELTAAMNETGIVNRCFSIASEHIAKAKASLALLPDTKNTKVLEELADMLYNRAN